MIDEDPTPMLVECTECQFSRMIRPDASELPADVVREHGQRSGHTLQVTGLDEDETRY